MKQIEVKLKERGSKEEEQARMQEIIIELQEVKREKKRGMDDTEDNVQHSKEKRGCRFKEEEKQLVTDGESMKRR